MMSLTVSINRKLLRILNTFSFLTFYFLAFSLNLFTGGDYYLSAVVKNSFVAEGELGQDDGYHGGGVCNLCGGDGPVDDELCTWYYPPEVCAVLTDVDLTSLWENVWEEKLKAAPHSKFASVSNCTITDTWTWAPVEATFKTTRGLRG